MSQGVLNLNCSNNSDESTINQICVNNDNDNEKSFILTLTILINDVKYETEKKMWLRT